MRSTGLPREWSGEPTPRDSLLPPLFAGFDEAGSVGTADLIAVIQQLGATGAATAEVGIHPGERDDPDLARYEWGYRWGDELEALLAIDVRNAVERAGFTLGSFAALGPVPQ